MQTKCDKSLPSIVNKVATVIRLLNNINVKGEENLDPLLGSIRILRTAMNDIISIVNNANQSAEEKEDEECSSET